MAVLRDWRVWAAALVVTVALGLIGGLLGVSGAAGGGGLVIGLIVARRIGAMRACPRCGKVSAAEPG